MKLKLRGKFNVLILTLLIMSVGMISVFLYQKEKAALIHKSLTNIKTIVQLEGLKVDDLIHEAMNDIKILSKSPTIQGVIRAREAKTDGSSEENLRSQVAGIFEAFIRAKPNYFQVRFIGRGGDGMEIVRVEKSEGQVIVTPKSKLQSKGRAPYFKATIKLSPGQVHISPINLNKELGVIAEPHIATIRIGAPVYDVKGKAFGLVVINLNLNPVLNSLIKRDKGLYVVNESGDFLAHQDPKFNFGFDLGKRHTIVNLFPGVALFWSGSDARQEHSFIDNNPDEELVYIWMQNIGSENFGRYIGIMKRQGVSEITGDLVSAFSETLILVVAFLMLSLMVGIFFTRRLTRPLEQLTDSVTQFALGRLDNKIVDETSDEIGELGRAFNTMVAERNKKEEVIKKLSNAVEQSPATIVITDVEGVIEYANPSFYELNGFARPDEVIGQNMQIVKSGEHSKDFVVNFWETILAGRIWRGEWCNKRKNGELYWASAVTSPLKDEQGNITHFVEVKEDITERRKKDVELCESKLKLERSNRALRDFASHAAHDLNEPLRKIKVFGNWLREDADNLDDKHKDYLRRMISASDRMHLLVEQLLKYSKVSCDGITLESFNLGEVVEQVVDDLEIRFAETGGILDCEDLPTVLADKMLITQLFQNLIANSLKYVRSGVVPEIKISSCLEETHHKIILKDNGIGMDEKNLERIFKPFDRLHGQSEYDGSGIGLAICRKVAEVHGGTIEVESKLGKGSTFIFTLQTQYSKTAIPEHR